VRTVPPTGTNPVATKVNRENTTKPPLGALASLVSPKSAMKLSTSAPLDVAALVLNRTCRMSLEAIAPRSLALGNRLEDGARRVIEDSLAAPCTAAAMLPTIVEND